MPSYVRKISVNQIYHVMLKGINREKVFREKEDKTKNIDTMRKKVENYCFYAYCVMDNYIHLTIKKVKLTFSNIKDTANKLAIEELVRTLMKKSNLSRRSIAGVWV